MPREKRCADTGGDHGKRGRSHPEARDQGGKAGHQLQILRDQQHRSANGDQPEEQDDQRDGERSVAEQVHIEQRIGEPSLPPNENRCKDNACNHRRDSDGHEAMFRHLFDAIDHWQHGGERERDAD